MTERLRIKLRTLENVFINMIRVCDNVFVNWKNRIRN